MAETNKTTVAQVEANTASLKATMDECELAEAFRDDTYGSHGSSGCSQRRKVKMCYGEDALPMPRENGIGIKELQDRQYREGVAIVRALREKADWCHNNNGNRTFEDWERMNKWLLEMADMLEYGLGYRRISE